MSLAWRPRVATHLVHDAVLLVEAVGALDARGYLLSMALAEVVGGAGSGFGVREGHR